MLDDLVKEIEEVEREISTYFNKIMSMEDMTLYRGQLLALKLNLLQMRQYSAALKINEKCMDMNAYSDRLHKFLKRLGLISALVTLTILPVGLLLYLYMWLVVKNYNSLMQNFEHGLVEFRDVFAKCDRITGNCMTFITKKVSDNSINLYNRIFGKEQDAVLSEEYAAQNVIDFYISCGAVPDGMPENIAIQIVKILQEDLETNEDDYLKLLEMAKAKVSEEEMTSHQEKSAQLLLKYDESCQKLQKMSSKKRK